MDELDVCQTFLSFAKRIFEVCIKYLGVSFFRPLL